MTSRTEKWAEMASTANIALHAIKTLNKQLEVPFCTAITEDERRKLQPFSLNLQGQLEVDKYLKKMTELSKFIDKTQDRPLENVSVFLIHHLTAEVLGVVGALRKLGCKDLVITFVGYSKDAEQTYIPALKDIPDTELDCLTLTQPESDWIISPSSLVASNDNPLPVEELNAAIKGVGYLDAMRTISSFLFVRLLRTAPLANPARKMLIIEDGGYIAPIITEAAFAHMTIGQYKEKYKVPEAIEGNLDPSLDLRTLLHDNLIGAVEHTRNGYDADLRVQLAHENQLTFPIFSIAVSYVKTQVESRFVASSILNALENVMLSQGLTLEKRNFLVMGSWGNIGRYVVNILGGRLDTPLNEHIFGCDLKLDSKFRDPRPKPSWVPALEKNGDLIEAVHYEDLPKEVRSKIDAIVGVTAGKTPGHPVFEKEHLLEWLQISERNNLFLASGSTKTAEFQSIVDWCATFPHVDELNPIDSNGYLKTSEADIEENLHVRGACLVDPISKRVLGNWYQFTWRDQPNKAAKNVYLIAEGCPINFLFYGVTTEIVELVLTQLVSASVYLTKTYLNFKPSLYAVDYSVEATTPDIFGTKELSNQTSFPIPLPSGQTF